MIRDKPSPFRPETDLGQLANRSISIEVVSRLSDTSEERRKFSFRLRQDVQPLKIVDSKQQFVFPEKVIQKGVDTVGFRRIDRFVADWLDAFATVMENKKEAA